MHKILKKNQILDDTWLLITQSDLLEGFPSDTNIIVTSEIWANHQATLKNRNGGLGLWLESHESIEAYQHVLENFQVFALNFVSFTDGRHYSNARILRENWHYAGEIRAVGDVQRDQIFYMHRCGFDAFIPKVDQDLEACLKALHDFSISYQAGADNPLPLFRRRPTLSN